MTEQVFHAADVHRTLGECLIHSGDAAASGLLGGAMFDPCGIRCYFSLMVTDAELLPFSPGNTVYVPGDRV